MKLNKIKIGSFVELYSEKCGISNLTVFDVSGINKEKEFFEPSRQVGKDTSNYKIVPPNYFACNLMHVGRDAVLPISLNTTTSNKIVSPAYNVFKIFDESLIIKEYFFMFLKSNEKDRFFWFNTDSSVRDGMDWEVFCDLQIDVPSIEIQKKYVAIYNALNLNLKIYESNLEDLKFVCDSYIENCDNKQPISSLIEEYVLKNLKDEYNLEKGINIEKKFIDTKTKSSNKKNQKVVLTDCFAYVPTTSRNGDKISIALNTEKPCIVSNTYITFKCNKEIIEPRYLYLWLKKEEFDRYSRFNSWGSVRETINFNEIQNYKITVPKKEVQKAIVKILDIYEKRKDIKVKLKKLINSICPILISGSIKEAKETNE